LQYTENAWDWMRYLGVESQDNPLHALFHNPDLSVYEVMKKMLDFWKKRDEFSRTGHRGDRIAITERGGDGRVINLVEYQEGNERLWKYDLESLGRIEEFLTILSDLTQWRYLPAHWSWDKWILYEFRKQIDSNLTNL